MPLFAVAYLLSAVVGRLVSASPLGFVVLWAPCGLYLATLLRVRSGQWPLYILAAVGANVAFDLCNGQRAGVALAFATINSLEAVAFAGLLRYVARVDPRGPATVRTAAAFVAGAALFGALGGALGAAALSASGTGGDFATSWFLWWSADAYSLLTLTPVFLILLMAPRKRPEPRWAVETGMLALAGACAVWLATTVGEGPQIVLSLLVLPIFLISAVRLGVPGIVYVSVAVALSWSSAIARGDRSDLLPGLEPAVAVAAVHLFLAVSGASSLLLAAAVEEKVRIAARTRRILDQSNDGILVHTVTDDGCGGRFVDVNERACRMLGLERAQLLKLSLQDLRPPESRAVARQQGYTLLRRGSLVFECTLLAHGGRPVPVEISASVVTEGDSSLVLSVVRDLSSRERGIAELRESEERFRSAVESFPAGVLVQTDGVYVYANPMALSLLGAERLEDLVGVRMMDLVPPGDAANVQADLRRITMGRLSTPAMERKVLTLQGEVVEVEVSGVPIVWDGRPSGLSYMVPMGERKKLERRLLQSQRLEAIGQLAGGVAHDFNNILTSILGQISLMRGEMELDAGVSVGLNEIADDAHRAADLTRRLLGLSRRPEVDPRPVDLNALVRGLHAVLGRVLGAPIRLVYETEEDLPAVHADPGQIEQVLLNLCLNARDAMPAGGTLSIATALVGPDEARVEGSDGDFVQISVIDEGTGIEPDALERIFEPFFTTKSEGKGTGLGLTTVQQIVQRHGGWIDVHSTPGIGSEFRVCLPVSAGAATTRGPVEAIVTVCARRGETVLLVEDEAGVRRLARRGLELLGYRVLEASDAEGARSIWAAQMGKIDLLLTDLVLPGRGTGLELARSLRALRPTLPVVVSSGYSIESVASEIESLDSVFLQKPYEFPALADRVRSALDKARGG